MSQPPRHPIPGVFPLQGFSPAIHLPDRPFEPCSAPCWVSHHSGFTTCVPSAAEAFRIIALSNVARTSLSFAGVTVFSHPCPDPSLTPLLLPGLFTVSRWNGNSRRAWSCQPFFTAECPVLRHRPDIQSALSKCCFNWMDSGYE